MDGLRPIGPVELPDGSLCGPDSTVYRPTPRRVTRHLGRALIAAGAAVVTDVYPEGLTFYPSRAAAHAWREVEPFLVVGSPPELRDLQWIGHVWESEDGRVVLRFDGRH